MYIGSRGRPADTVAYIMSAAIDGGDLVTSVSQATPEGGYPIRALYAPDERTIPVYQERRAGYRAHI